MSTPAFPRLAVIGLRTSDVSATVHFYRDFLGLTLLSHHGHRPAFDLGDGLNLVIIEAKETPEPPLPAARFPVLAFAVKDLEDMVERLQLHGIELPWGVESNSGTRWAEFYDPGGNLIEFAQFGN